MPRWDSLLYFEDVFVCRLCLGHKCSIKEKVEFIRGDDVLEEVGKFCYLAERTHRFSVTLSYLIDQPSLVVESGVHPTLHERCHHQIAYGKFNLQIEYLPAYERLVWNFKRADVNTIITAIKPS